MDDNANQQQQQQLPPAPPQPSAPAVSTSNAVQQVPPVMTFHQAPLPAQHISHPNFTPYPPYGSPQQPQCGHPSSVNIHQAPTYGYGPQVSHPYQLAQPSSSLMAPSPYQGSSQHGFQKASPSCPPLSGCLPWETQNTDMKSSMSVKATGKTPKTVFDDQEEECPVCLDMQKHYVMLSCGHYPFCGQCLRRSAVLSAARSLIHDANDDRPRMVKCPVCRKICNKVHTVTRVIAKK